MTVDLLVSRVTLTIVPSERVHTLVATLVGLHLGTLVHVAMQRLVTVILTVRLLVAHQVVVNALAVVATELVRGACGVVLVWRKRGVNKENLGPSYSLGRGYDERVKW